HARALLAVENPAKQKEIAIQIVSQGLTVRDVENIIKHLNNPKKDAVKKEKTLELKDFEERIKRVFSTRVQIKGTESKGKIVIDYYSKDDLDRIYDILNK
ncbi:MAG: chromosome partitioning protein ParB, partial [Clostridia bacterium]|nr:chromosome partitioning protein ParB [Clostridia bacterium]